MFEKILPKKTQSNLALLTRKGILKDFYLAGGTGLALQLMHRISKDLDFFTKKEINPQTLAKDLKRLGKFAIEKEDKNTLIGNFKGTKIAFFTYDYPLLFPLKKISKIKVADVRDIGCMKISAISSRGSKKDFVDLFFLCKKVISLKKLLKLFEKKYKSVDYNMVHILKSLTYFEDAKRDPMPRMLIKVSWKEIKDFFQQEVKKLV